MTPLRRCGALLTLVLAGTAVGVAVPEAAHATTFCTSGVATAWKTAADGDFTDDASWTHGVPTSACDASITLPGTYTVTVTDFEGAQNLTLGGTAGTQTLEVLGTTKGDGTQLQADVTVGTALSVGTHGVVELTSSGTNPGNGILGGGTLDNHGIVRTDPDPDSLAPTSTQPVQDIRANVTNEADGTMTFNASVSACGCGSGGTWNNDGTLTTAAGTSSDLTRTGAGVSFTQAAATGTIVNQGHLIVDGSFTNTAGSTSGDNPVEVCGQLDASGPGTASFAFAQSSVCNGWNLADDIGPATSVLADNATTTSQIIVTASQALTNQGTLTLDGVAGSASVQLNGQAITNEGTIQFEQQGQSLLTAPITNHGTFGIGAGDTVVSHGTFTQTAGTLSTAAGSTLTSNQDIDLSGGTITNDGSLVTSGTFRHTGGGTTGQPIQICSGILQASGPGVASFVLPHDSGNACGNGQISGDIGIGDTVEIQATDVAHDTFFTSGLTNRGTVRLTATGAGYNQLHPQGGSLWTNTGALTVASGTVNDAMTVANTGVVTVATGATMNGEPNLQQGGIWAVGGALNSGLTVSGGTLQGSGTITSTDGVTVTGGTVHPQTTLTVDGPYTQSAAGTLAIGVASATNVAHLAVTGAATVAGTLAVTSPKTVSGTVRPVTAGSLTGTFSPVTFSAQVFTTTYDPTGLSLTAVPPAVVIPPVVTPPVITPPVVTPPVQALTKVHLTPGSFTAGKKAALTVSLTRTATISYAVTRTVAGHKVGKSCNIHKTKTKGKRCAATVFYVRGHHSGAVGTNTFSVPFTHLKAGRYTVTVTVPGANGTVLKKTFTLVVKAKKKKVTSRAR